MGDIMENNRENGLIAPPKKKSLFTKSAIAKISEGPKGLDMFSRANELFPQRIEEEQRKKEKKFAKLERKRSSASAEAKEFTPLENKKRRTSGQMEDREGYSSEEWAHNEHVHGSSHTRKRESLHTSPGSRSSSQQKASKSPTSLSARYHRDIKEHKADPPKLVKGYISLTDSDAEGESARKSTIPVREIGAQPIISLDDDNDYSAYMPRKPPSPPDDDESEEEFPELVEAAKQRERLKAKQRLEAQNSFQEKNHTYASTFDDMFDDAFDIKPKIDVDPVVNILITSRMGGTHPLMVKRKLSQRLREAKLAWCDKQVPPEGQTSEEFKKSIFLTWKDHRLFDSTTCRTLGAKFDSDGNISYDADGMDSQGNIHLQAWTKYAWGRHQKEKAERAKRVQAEANGEEIVEKKEPEVQKTKLILKARDSETFKLVVKPNTTIAKIVGAFRGARDVPEDKEVVLYFDGDELGLESTVEETELGDMDVIDVVIR